MFSDTYKIKLVDDVLYEVYGRVYICIHVIYKVLCTRSNLYKGVTFLYLIFLVCHP